jgi:hypothetical protein
MLFLKNNPKAIIITVAVAVLIIVGGFVALRHFYLNNKEIGNEDIISQPEVEVSPELIIIAEKDSVSGIDKDSGFIIKSPLPLSLATVKAQLSIVPEVGYTLQQRTDNELYIALAKELEPDKIYNILLAENAYEPPLSWAFQTKDSFRVTGTFPADNGRSVPINSGIEFNFSQDAANIDPFVFISPELLGRFEQFSDKTIVFIPSRDMEYDTTYTITLSASLSSQAGDILPNGYSFSFKTERVPVKEFNYSFYAYDGISETFTSTDPIFIKLYADNQFADKEVQIAIYRYPGFDAYIAALKSDRLRENAYLPTDGLTKIVDYQDRLLMNNEMYWHTAFLPLQENPGQGWYLVDINTPAGPDGTDGQHAQKILQITDIAVYSQTSHNQMLFWLNDTKSGEPLAGANINVEGQTVNSDQNGLALLDIVQQEDDKDAERYRYYSRTLYMDRLVRIQHGEQLFGEYLDLYGDNEIPLNRLYYTYVYTDRAAYQPDDTVHFWGMVLPRTSNSAKPKSIMLDWTDGGKYPDGIEIEVRADGTFAGELKLEKHNSGWYEYEFTLDGKILAYTSITVVKYTKPIYTASLSVDKTYYRKNDKINVMASASFYDGTPAEGLGLSLSYSYSEVQVNLDKNGRGQATFTPGTGTNWQPRYDSIYCETESAEDQAIYCSTSTLIFPSDYMLLSSASLVEDGFILQMESYSIDFARVDSGKYSAKNDYEDLRGAPAEIRGEAFITQVEYIKSRTGEYYDFISKKVVERFTYERQERVVESFNIQTEQGRFTSQIFNYPDEDNVYYYFTFNCVCPDASTLAGSNYVRGYRSYYYYDDSNEKNIKKYYFQQYQPESANDDEEFGYSLFDKINIRLTDQNDQIPQQGRVLYTVLGKELFSYTTVNSSSFSLDFLPLYVPNVVIVGAYFDGKHIFSVVNSSTLKYRYTDNELNISVATDKERYQPGQEVKVKLNVTDNKGQGKAANYLLSVADEAAFAIMDQDVYPLSSVYRNIYIDYHQYASYIQPYEVSYGAECGDDGSDYNIRRDFVDTVAFLSGQTNDKGEASLSFKLADNLTSWRLTSIAFYENTVDKYNIPYVGKDIRNIESGLPFFINQVLNEKYLTGDSVGLSLRCAGTDIRNSDIVKYEVSLSGGDVKTGQTAEAPAGDFCQIDLGTLPVGKYKVLIRADCGNHKDALEKEIEVVDSLLLLSIKASGNLQNGVNIDAKRFPVSIVLYDFDNTLYYDILYMMLHSYGKRSDQIIARTLAGKRLNEINGDSFYPETLVLDDEETSYYSYSGLRLFPYAETDPLLTAKAVAVAPEFFNQQSLADYFTRILHNTYSTPLDIAAAYMGLGALKRPVLLDLRKLFAEAKASEDFTLLEKLYLATGLALLGDSSTVSGWYEDEIHDKLVQSGQGLRYQQSGDDHEGYQLTASAAMLACLLNHPDHKHLLLYLTTNRSTTYLPLLDIAFYVGKYSPKPQSPAAFSYQLAGETIRQTFDKSRQLYLEFGEKQLAEANFQVLMGNVGYHAYYSGGFAEAEKTLPTGVKISQHLNSESFKLGDVVTVSTTLTFNNQAPIGYYYISQIVPSGLRFIGVKDYSYYQSNWYYQIGEGGMLNFYINPLQRNRNDNAFGRPTMPESVTFEYEARAVLPGTYIMEAPALSYSGGNTIYAGERHHISVVK